MKKLWKVHRAYTNWARSTWWNWAPITYCRFSELHRKSMELVIQVFTSKIRLPDRILVLELISNFCVDRHRLCTSAEENYSRDGTNVYIASFSRIGSNWQKFFMTKLLLICNFMHYASCVKKNIKNGLKPKFNYLNWYIGSVPVI